MKRLILVLGFAFAVMCACTKEGMYYTHRYITGKDTVYFADERRIEVVDSVYVMPKKRTKAERFIHLSER